MVSYKFIKKGVIELIKELALGPVIVAHVVSKEIKSYKSGIFNGDGCKDKKVNHSALLVGYNLDADVPYFILKNAWGPEWGDGGYYWISIGELDNKNMGTC